MTQIDWVSVEDQLPGENDGSYQLVIFHTYFFGRIHQEIAIAYFDDPTDYEDGGGKGWLLQESSAEISVTHWASIEHYKPETRFDGMDQSDFISEFGNLRPELGIVKRIKSAEEE